MKVEGLVIITQSFLNIPAPCFGIIYDTYTIGTDHHGYEICAFYFKDKNVVPTVDLGGFSDYEMGKYTIPFFSVKAYSPKIFTMLETWFLQNMGETLYIPDDVIDHLNLHYIFNEDVIKHTIREYNLSLLEED